ncbi:XRE family transcriptional regulator [Rheinheimera baltica]|uniref:XRE family transcriptional regulator n=1 Tax=Rheinheimera baltica TaxID=67576 RepID=UPI0003F5F228|nr:XRE family transcriptional regulator [Rheinheimera baltica]
MDMIEFGSYILQIRDNVLTRKDMAEKTQLHVNTIRSYELEGRLPDIDYLAALALETGHCFSDLVNKRLLAGKLGRIVEKSQLMVSDLLTEHRVDSAPETVSLPLFGSNRYIKIDVSLLPHKVPSSALLVVDTRHHIENPEQVILLNKEDKTVQDGELYVVDIGNGAAVWRLQIGLGGSMILSSEKSGITPLTVPREQIDHITILGRVVCVLSYR